MRKRILGSLGFILASFIIIAFLSLGYVENFITHDHTCTVSEKYVKNTKESSRYLVVCGGNTYKISDSFITFKFDSSDIYASIKADTKYNLKTNGWRIPIMSDYENILSIQEIH